MAKRDAMTVVSTINNRRIISLLIVPMNPVGIVLN